MRVARNGYEQAALDRPLLVASPVASIIIPMTAATPFMEYVNEVCLRTLRESCSAEVLVLANNTPNPGRRDGLRRLCSALGFRFDYIEGPFSQSVFFNHGIDRTSGDYIVFVNADSIFYSDWLDHLIELWREQPDYYALWVWGFCPVDMGLGCRSNRTYERRIIPTHQPTSAIVLRRSDGYRWDEQFPLWEMDADFQFHCAKHSYKTGLCMWSRVDHLHGTVCVNIDEQAHLGMEDHRSVATNRLKAKWGLK